MNFFVRCLFAGVLELSLAWPAVSQTTSATVLHRFTGPDGALPLTSVTEGSGGVLYGTTYGGGAHSFGAVYALTPPVSNGAAWTETTIYSFAGLPAGDGALLFSGVITDPAGNLYGTTENGGTTQSGCPFPLNGCGTIFELSPPTSGGSWTETVLHVFESSTDGNSPHAALVRDANGNLYGTTASGGPKGWGTVFQLAPPVNGGAWTFTALYSFSGAADGGNPYGWLVLDQGGNLYGTTLMGGTNFTGTAFRLAPPSSPGGLWTESVMHSFGGANDGSMPYAGMVFDSKGALHGTTDTGSGTATGGIVFRLIAGPDPTKSWTEQIIHIFENTQGLGSFGGVAFDPSGNLWGATVGGGNAGCPVGCGSLFQLAPPTGGVIWPVQRRFFFNPSYSGANPNGSPLIGSDGNVYVTTSEGGSGGALGTVVSTPVQ